MHVAKRQMLAKLLLPLLPKRVQPYAKAAVALLGALVSITVLYFGDEPKVAVVVQVLTAMGVYAQPNGNSE